MWPIVDLFRDGARKLKDFSPLFFDNSDHSFLLDSLKQLSFYSDAYGKCNWSKPKEIIDEQTAKKLILTAKVLVGSLDKIESEDLLELWMKFMKFPESSSLADRMGGLLSFYNEAEKNGLLAQGSRKEMENFILFGFKPKK